MLEYHSATSVKVTIKELERPPPLVIIGIVHIAHSYVRLAGAVGIEPTQAILETASPALEHALLYSPRRAMLWVVPGFAHWPDNLITPIYRVVPPPPSCGQERGMCPPQCWRTRTGKVGGGD